jgi:hypothetical protein
MFQTLQSRGLAVAATLALTMATSAHAQVVVRDAETGQLRAATAAEVQAMNKTSGTGRSANAVQPRIGMNTGKLNPQPIQHADGTVEQELDASTLSYTVAKRNADGSISMVCVTGKDEEAKALAAKPARSAAVSKKEHNHDVK